MYYLEGLLKTQGKHFIFMFCNGALYKLFDLPTTHEILYLFFVLLTVLRRLEGIAGVIRNNGCRISGHIKRTLVSCKNNNGLRISTHFSQSKPHNPLNFCCQRARRETVTCFYLSYYDVGLLLQGIVCFGPPKHSFLV